MTSTFSLSNELVMSSTTKHPFHMVDPSPWPLTAAFGAFFMVFGLVAYMHFYNGGFRLLSFGFLLLLTSSILWWSDVISEATFEGHHTSYVRTGLRLGMALFILSEVMFFFAFFWAFFHSSLNPVYQMGCVWPPKGINPPNPWHVPLLNTFMLVTSGAYCNWAQYSMLAGYRRQTMHALLMTLMFAVWFTGLQAYEYLEASFNISDSVFGSVFYMTTGLHGFHVMIGTIFLMVCLFSLLNHHFTSTHHVGFECAAWYWHFVDVVWLFVYFFIYWWGYSA